MKKLYFLFGFVGLAALNSCTDHQVIPPPVPLIDLNCECDGTVADSAFSYSDSCYYESVKNIVTGGTSSARYNTRVENEDVIGGVQVEIRSLNWTDDGSNNPTLAEWKTWLIDSPSPGFSDNPGHNGIEVRWTDPNGNVWINDTTTNALCIQSFTFNTMIQESDSTGDYAQFDATFSCPVLNSDYGTVDSMKCLENVHMRSAFKLE